MALGVVTLKKRNKKPPATPHGQQVIIIANGGSLHKGMKGFSKRNIC